ncbi:MAG: polysaccharide biosynthesis tyrosine autokinase [Verrucomicrobiota bacterium]|jgi:capsular exopolysaccharide synthesis family protein
MKDHLPAKVEAPQPPDPHHQSYGPEDYQAVPAAALDMRRFFAFLLRYWWLPVLTTVLALEAAVGYIRWAPPMFVSTARMWETEKMRLPQGGAFTEDLQNYLGTQMELLQSDKLRELALERLRAQGTNTIPLDKRGKPLMVDLKVAQPPKTTVLEVEAFSPDPAYTQAYLNAVMEEYLKYKNSFRKAVSGDTLASISEQALLLEKELKADEDALTDFERTNNLATLEEEGRIAGGYLARLKTQLSDLELESQLLEATPLEQDWTGQDKTHASGFLVNSLSDADSSSLSAAATERQMAWKELELLKIQREKLGKYLRPMHPKIVKLDADIERGQKLIDLYRNQSRQALKISFDSVQASIKQWEGKVVEANDRIAEADRLKLDVKRTQSLYDPLVLLLQTVDINRNVDRETLAVFEPAAPALRSHRRDWILLFLALVGGSSGGAGIVFLVQLRDDRFSSIAEVDEKFGDSIVGQVPEMRQLRRNGSLPLLEPEGQHDIYAESYRNLRSALLFLPVEGERPKILLITSALPSEGKSTIAANLARTLALGGSRVLLVDGDLRKGRLHELMGQPCEPGLTEVIGRPGDADVIIHAGSVPNLAFLSRGSSPRNPGDLLLRPELDQIFARWRRQFDYVLIDSCPVFAADDVTALAHKVDGTLFVVRRRFSRGAVVREALELLLHRQAKVLGLIFNRADASARSYHYFKYADYYPPAKPK